MFKFKPKLSGWTKLTLVGQHLGLSQVAGQEKVIPSEKIQEELNYMLEVLLK